MFSAMLLPLIDLHTFFSKKVIKSILKISLPVIFLAFIFISLFYGYQDYTLRNYYKSLNKSTLNHLQVSLESLFHNMRGETKLVSANPLLLAAVKNPQGPEARIVKEQWKQFCEEDRVYDQIRLLNPNGMEILRVQLTREGTENVPDTRLQDKSDSYYFRESLNLSPGDIYFSKLDLNMENNKVALPVKPVIRISIPIWGNGQIKGIIVMNYLASNLFNDIETHGKLAESKIIILNEDGNYLRGISREDDWAFMYSNKKSIKSFPGDFPDIWKTLQYRSSGNVENLKGMFQYQWISMGSHTSHPEYTRRFALISYISSGHLSGLLFPYRLASVLTAIASVPVAFLIALLMIRYKMMRVLSMKKLRDSKHHQKVILESLGEGIFGINEDGIITFVNYRASNILGFSKSEILGRHLHDVVHPSGEINHSKEDCPLTAIMEIESEYIKSEDQFYLKNGRPIDTSYIIRPVPSDEKINGYVLSFSDITSEKRDRQQIERLAFFDPLTDLPNKNLFLENLNRSIQNLNPARKSTFLLYINLDRFKHINDVHGHSLGDQVLIEFSRRLTTLMLNNEYISRIGSDEFAVLCHKNFANNESAVENASMYADKLLHMMKTPFKIENESIHLTASIGIVILPNNESTGSVILSQGDTAVSNAKREGRNTISFFKNEMKEKVQNWHIIRNRMIYSLNHDPDSFYMLYQPKVDIDTGITGMESLIRWNDSELGMISPSVFIPIAEESGLILHMSELVVDMVCRDIQTWIHSDLEKYIGYISVNISAEQFHLPDFREKILSHINSYHIGADKIELEITERTLVQDVVSTKNNLNKMRSDGFRFSIDDFGTGYSSLSYLQELPIDKLKIDRSLVQDIDKQNNLQAITRAIILMSQSLGIDVIAEGVETTNELDFMVKTGCREFQGYYFYKPMSAGDISHLFSEGMATNLMRA